MEFDMKDILGDIPVPTDCPVCSEPLELNSTEFLNGDIITCPHCQSKIELQTTESE